MSAQSRLGTNRVRHIEYPVAREPRVYVEKYCPLCNKGADPQLMEMQAEAYDWAVMEHFCPYPPTPAYEPKGSIWELLFYFALVMYIASQAWDAIQEHSATNANPDSETKKLL